jgi:hypothetical protein
VRITREKCRKRRKTQEKNKKKKQEKYRKTQEKRRKAQENASKTQKRSLPQIGADATADSKSLFSQRNQETGVSNLFFPPEKNTKKKNWKLLPQGVTCGNRLAAAAPCPLTLYSIFFYCHARADGRGPIRFKRWCIFTGHFYLYD